MARIDVKAINPTRYARIRDEQQTLIEKYCGQVTLARLCPYCNRKLELLYQGSHGAISIKCPQCGEEVFFPPVAFRRMDRGRRRW